MKDTTPGSLPCGSLPRTLVNVMSGIFASLHSFTAARSAWLSAAQSMMADTLRAMKSSTCASCFPASHSASE